MPPENDLAAAQAAGNNSSDFVRKLYKMLEDPTYNSVVRWSPEGDSFVVLENEKFTKTILPKHFKHSNFASFVRQLNKYDFHKVRHNDESGEAPYGRDAWEFRHPEFRADRKDNLDNIRRKAPAPRKQQATEDGFPTTQLVVLGETLTATQHQIQALQDQCMDLANANKILVNEVLALHKMVRTQSQVSNELISHLSNLEDRRRNSRHSAHSSHSSHSGPSYHPGALGLLPDGADEPAPELRRARELLQGVSPDSQGDRELERLSVAYHQNGSPADSATSSVMFAQPGVGPMPLMADPMHDNRHLVYPVGTTTGIDPFHSDHIHNIPYTRPQSTPNVMAEAAQITPPLKEQTGSLWAGKKPRILLVEDDKTCARIGSKFLSHIECTVEVAKDGLEAVEKINQDAERFDLIFMDIIMPNLDGVSATAMIRMVAQTVPIIAMTSNIRQEDIACYFQFGMNDVLAKPFTKDGMTRILKKHLSRMLKDPLPFAAGEDGSVQPVAGAPGPQMPQQAFIGTQAGMPLTGMPPMAAGQQIKFEQTPIQSPTTTSSWHSPRQMTHPSPQLENGGGYMNAVGAGAGGMVLTPGGTQRPGQYGAPQQQVMGGQIGGQMSGVMPGVMPGMNHNMGHPGMQNDGMGGMGGSDDRPEKRQRLYAPGQGAFVQP